VRSILKALGLTIWGLVAFGLVAIFIFVGYEVALKYRATSSSVDTAKAANNQGRLSLSGPSVGPADSAGGTPDVPHISAFPRAPDATRKLLSGAVQSRQYTSAIEYGRELVDQGSAGPADLSMIAQSYFSISDCPNAQLSAQRAKEAFQKAGREPDEDLRRIDACCVSGGNKPRIVLSSAEKARIDLLLNKSEAAKAESGGPFVRLGELYYGIGQYELAIAALIRGLEKGHVPHLDEAYVYLGRSEQAVGDLDAARNAFAQLKDVPGISPRVLRLWTLYAETQLTASKVASATDAGECRKSGTGGS
jgi:tetratricopeptide (TPR) repeat protein